MSRTFYLTWPAGKEDEAQAYKEQADIEYQLLSGEQNGVFYTVQTDRHGQPFVAYFGPPLEWVYQPVAEPPSLIPLRQNAVLHEFPEWPADPEEPTEDE